MTWVAPKTWASGDVLTAADMNTYVRDQIRHLGHHSTGGGPIARRTHSAAQNNILTGTPMSFDTDVFTPVGFEPAATSATELISNVSPQTGYFILGAACRGANTGAGNVDLGIYDLSFVPGAYAGRMTVIAAATGGIQLAITVGHYTSNVADYTADINHNFSDLDISANAQNTPCAFWGVWVGQPV